MKKALELSKVRRGEYFILDGVEFVKLDEDAEAVFAVMANTLPDCCQFEDDGAEREDHNNFNGSNLEKAGERWTIDEHSEVFKAIVERPIDLTTMDGMTDYGQPYALVRALTIDEYRKYRRFIPLTDKPYWLATAWTTKSSPGSSTGLAFCIDAGGTVYSGSVYNALFAPRPALYLQSSILVSVECNEEPQKSVQDYTDTELMDELYRRRRASYDQT